MQYALNYSGTEFCPLKIKISQFPGGFPMHCKNHWKFSITFEQYCSEVDL